VDLIAGTDGSGSSILKLKSMYAENPEDVLMFNVSIVCYSRQYL